MFNEKGKGGRPKGSTTRVQVSKHFTQEEIKDFFADLKVRAKTDTKIAIYLAEQLTGKATQPHEGEFEANLTVKFDNAFTPETKRNSPISS